MSAAAERLRARIDQRTLWEVEADIREVVAENDRLRQEVVDARGEATAEMARADLAEAERDQALERVRELDAERDRGIVEYLRAHPEHTAELMRAEMGRLARRNRESAGATTKEATV